MAEPGDKQMLDEAMSIVSELPTRVLITYVRLWQLETWLRLMVYIELRARFGNDWQKEVAGKRTTYSQAADARLHHMPTPERDPLSYATFTDLCDTLEDHWDLFKEYLPPRDIWIAKLEEVKQIRNRAAHFRIGHEDDLSRVLQLMRDVDQGFWKFCTSYNNPRPILPYSVDPVIKRFANLNQFPYFKVGKKEWAMAGIADPNAVINVTVEALRRPWQQPSNSRAITGQVGSLYDVQIIARGDRIIDYTQFLEGTVQLHPSIVHICLDQSWASVRVTIPAVLGTKSINALTRFRE